MSVFDQDQVRATATRQSKPSESNPESRDTGPPQPDTSWYQYQQWLISTTRFQSKYHQFRPIPVAKITWYCLVPDHTSHPLAGISISQSPSTVVGSADFPVSIKHDEELIISPRKCEQFLQLTKARRDICNALATQQPVSMFSPWVGILADTGSSFWIEIPSWMMAFGEILTETYLHCFPPSPPPQARNHCAKNTRALCICVYMYVYVCMGVYVCICVYMCVCVCVCVCVCA